jgi:CDP-paratose 2-epimerase
LHRVLVTGGAGFVGANLGIALAQRHPDWELTALDNLHRRGSELNVARLEEAGIGFVRADVRDREALSGLAPFDALVECSAEPSALVGMTGDTSYPFETNLVGAYNCLELARAHAAAFVFLSTSRVYPYPALGGLSFNEAATRLELDDAQPLPGASAAGISERFPLDGPRTLYGATKLAAELLAVEYRANFGIPVVIDRCGVIAGPWQMGRVDQGVFSFWLFHHEFEKPLTYIGHGAEGKQVRDLLHVDDLVDLVEDQLVDTDRWDGFTGNVGGGREVSLSLAETTDICRQLTGNEVPIEPVQENRPGDVPLYISDCSLLFERTDWRPRRGAEQILDDIYTWLVPNRDAVAASLGL